MGELIRALVLQLSDESFYITLMFFVCIFTS
jgi:hypothetical protein